MGLEVVVGILYGRKKEEANSASVTLILPSTQCLIIPVFYTALHHLCGIYSIIEESTDKQSFHKLLLTN
jgi:hypothetical protein